MTGRIRILVTDDHAVVRSGLRLFLLAFPDLELVGEAVDGEDAVRFCAVNHPDVVLMDLLMPGMNGVDATRAIRKQFPQIQVIALTSFPEEQLVQDVIEAGAIGFLLKNTQAADLADAIRAAHQGRSTLAPEAATALVQALGSGALHETLTEREWDVYRLILAGKTNAEIAKQLSLGLSTIKSHVSAVLSKLGVNNRAEAIAYGAQHHLIGSTHTG